MGHINQEVGPERFQGQTADHLAICKISLNLAGGAIEGLIHIVLLISKLNLEKYCSLPCTRTPRAVVAKADIIRGFYIHGCCKAGQKELEDTSLR